LKTANNIIAPGLLIAAMLALILFQRVLFNYAVYIDDAAQDLPGRYIIYNGERYLPDRFFIFAFISYIFAFVLPILFYIKLFKSEGYTKELYFKLPEVKNITLVIYGTGAIISGTAFAASLIYYMGGSPELREAIIDSGGNPVYDLSVLLVFILLPAVCEEVMFRSVISREYEKYGALLACIISSAAFAMLRFSFAMLPVYFFAGVILYILTKASGSILFAVIAHVCYNFFNLYIWNRFANVLRFEQNRLIFIFLAAVIFIIFMIAMINKVEKIYFYKSYINEPTPPRPVKKFSARVLAVFLSPVLIAALIIYFILTVT
jgi:membrane protease YdiL (CAAX protease family)